MSLLHLRFYNNEISTWLLALALAAMVYGLLVLARRHMLVQLRRLASHTRTAADDFVTDVLLHTRTFFTVFLAFYAGSRVLFLTPPVARGLRIVGVVILTMQVALWGNAVISALLTRRMEQHVQNDRSTVSMVGLLGFAARAGLWAVLLLLALDNVGVDITALVAGLGIGGIAVALAVQNVLGDLLASLAIVLDKPFVPGDFIVVGDLPGTVERIGVKTTRVRALSGEQIIFPNAELVGSRVRNFTRLRERRIVFTLGLVYDTPADLLQRAPALVRECIEAQELTRFDRCHFARYSAYSLDFEVVYFVLDPDYNRYMDIQQAINLAIFQSFAEAGIEFAFPTQTLHLTGAEAGVSA